MENQNFVKFAQKVARIQDTAGKIERDMKNPYHKSMYFDINKLLEKLQPIMRDEKMVIIQPIMENRVVSQIVDTETGLVVDSSLELPIDPNPQKLGSAITYYRRYTLQSLLGLQADDDDDGNSASGKTSKSQNGNGKKTLSEDNPKWEGAIKNLAIGRTTLGAIKKHYRISDEKALMEQVRAYNKKHGNQ